MLPQWSPPTSGGSTASSFSSPRAAHCAAMEPADQRREHLVVGADLGAVVNGAAMEPADQRREHKVSTMVMSSTVRPQWSPPTSGGSTFALTIAARLPVPPQWSPPTSGGSTARKFEPSDLGESLLVRAGP